MSVEDDIDELRERLRTLEDELDEMVRSANPITITNATISGTTSFSSGGTAPTAESYPWNWNMVYYDLKGYTGRVVQPGWSGTFNLSTQAWPAGYKVPNGQPGGGYPSASSKPSGSEPIRLCPPTSGTGRIMFVTQMNLTIVNNDNSRAGLISYGLGVSYVNGPSKPMYPYLGVAHALETLDNSSKPTTIPPNSTVVVTCPARMDLMDNNFQSDEPIPGWPNWQLQLSIDGKLMYPAVTPTGHNMGLVPLTIMDIFGFGYVC